jgi:hypothetical protein
MPYISGTKQQAVWACNSKIYSWQGIQDHFAVSTTAEPKLSEQISKEYFNNLESKTYPSVYAIHKPTPFVKDYINLLEMLSKHF